MNNKRYEGLSAGIILIGIGLVFLIPGLSIWPWILVIVGLAGLPASLAANRGWLGWQSAFWMIGLALLFWSGFFWPGILILAGLSMLLGGLQSRRPSQPKGSDEMPADSFSDHETRHQIKEHPFSPDEPLYEDDDWEQEKDRSEDNDTRRL